MAGSRTVAEWIEEFRDDPEFIADGLILDLAEQILARLEQLGLTRADLARRLGKSPAYVTKLLRGANVSLLTVAKLAVAVDMEPRITLEPRERVFSTARRPWPTKASQTPLPQMAAFRVPSRAMEIAA